MSNISTCAQSEHVKLEERSSVLVVLRSRPPNQRERDAVASRCLNFQKHIAILRNQASIKAAVPESPSAGGQAGVQPQELHYTFDYCFEENSTQEDVYNYVSTRLLPNLWEGYNCCLFAYGQTGSGKTYTMMGSIAQHELARSASKHEFVKSIKRTHQTESRNQDGLLPRLCREIFQPPTEGQHNRSTSYYVVCSFFEIYCEKVRDLLGGGCSDVNPTITSSKDSFSPSPSFSSFSPSLQPSSNLRIRQHPVRGVYVEGLSTHVVHDFDAAYELLLRGNAERVTAETKMNDRSSRSHAIFTLHVTMVTLGVSNTWDDTRTHKKFSKFHSVDLAGSERVSLSGAIGERLDEAKNINLSLTTLGRVIDALVENNKGRRKVLPPYRESALTFFLSDSLGGNSKTIMIATVSSNALNFQETASTLRYASKAREIINVTTINEQVEGAQIVEQLKLQIRRLTVENESLKKKHNWFENIQSEHAKLKTQLTELQISERKKCQELLEERNQSNATEIRLKSLIAEKESTIHSMLQNATTGGVVVPLDNKNDMFLQQIIQDMHVEMDSLRQDVYCKEERIVELENEMSDIVLRVDAKDKQLMDFETDLNFVQQQCDELHLAYRIATENNKHLEYQLKETTRREQEWRDEISTLTQQCNKIPCGVAFRGEAKEWMVDFFLEQFERLQNYEALTRDLLDEYATREHELIVHYFFTSVSFRATLMASLNIRRSTNPTELRIDELMSVLSSQRASHFSVDPLLDALRLEHMRLFAELERSQTRNNELTRQWQEEMYANTQHRLQIQKESEEYALRINSIVEEGNQTNNKLLREIASLKTVIERLEVDRVEALAHMTHAEARASQAEQALKEYTGKEH